MRLLPAGQGPPRAAMPVPPRPAPSWRQAPRPPPAGYHCQWRLACWPRTGRELQLLEALGQIIRLYGHPGTAVLLAFGCRSRGSDDHVGFLRAARAAMYEVTHLELDEAVAAEVDDGVDVVELKLGADWEP